MHSAPSVNYPVGRSRFAAAALLLMWLAGAVATALLAAQAQSGWRIAVACGALAAAGGFAALNWWRSPAGQLAWDGQAWSWSAAGQSATGLPVVALDLQRWLLLRWTGTDGGRWLWLERRTRADRWDDLRRAVYSRARLKALPGASPPIAKP